MKTLDCPFCGNSNTVTRKIVKQEFDYKGQQLVLDDYVVHECSKCYESFEIPDDNTTNQEKLVAFQRKVDGLLRLIRKDPSGSIETLTQADEERALRNRA